MSRENNTLATLTEYELTEGQKIIFGNIIIEIVSTSPRFEAYKIEKEEKSLVMLEDESRNPWSLPCVIRKSDIGKWVLVPLRAGFQLEGSPAVKVTNLAKEKSQIQTYLDSTKRLSLLEEDESRIGANNEKGWKSSQSALGYCNACKLFLHINKQNLNSNDIKQLEVAVNIFDDLYKDATTLEKIANLSWYDLCNNKAYIANPQITKDLALLANSQKKKLFANSEIYLNYGVGPSLINNQGIDSHHEIMKIKYTGDEKGVGKYEVYIYNAGYEAEWIDVSKRTVEAVKYYQLNIEKPEELDKFLQAINERKLTGDKGPTAERFNELTNQINTSLTLKGVRADKAQIRGNCTTRSNRQALMDILPPELFSKFYNFVSNRPVLEQMAGKYMLSMEQQESLPSKIKPSSFVLNDQQKLRVQSQILNGKLDLSNVNAELITEQFSWDNKRSKGTLLHYAISQNKDQLFNKCIELGMDGSELNNEGHSALQYAIQKNDKFALLIINKLSNKNAKLEELSIYGETPMLVAIKHDRLDVIDALLDSGVNISAEANNQYAIIKKLGEKAIVSEQALATEYIAIMQKALAKIPVNQLNLYAKDGSENNLLNIVHQIITAQPALQDQTKDLLIQLHQIDLRNPNPQYLNIAGQNNFSLSKFNLEDIKKLVPEIVEKNSEFLAMAVSEGLLSGKVELAEYLVENFPQNKLLMAQLFDSFSIILELIEPGIDQQFKLTVKMFETMANGVPVDLAQAKKAREVFAKFFSPAEVDGIMSTVKIKQQVNPGLNKLSKEDEKLGAAKEYKTRIEQEVQITKDKYYQFGDFTRGIFNSLFGVGGRSDSYSPTELVSGAIGKFTSLLWGKSNQDSSMNKK